MNYNVLIQRGRKAVLFNSKPIFENLKSFKFSTLILYIGLFAWSSVTTSCSRDTDKINTSEKIGETYKTDLRSAQSNIIYPLNDYKIWQIKNTVMTVIFPINNTIKNHIWIVQGLSMHTTESMTTISNVNFGAYNKNYIKLNYDSTELVYLLTGATYNNYASNAVGLIKLDNPVFLNSLRTINDSTKVDIIEDIQAKAWCKNNPTGATPATPDSDCKCAGGYGATSCECGGGAVSISWHEAVSCGIGMYACCSGL